MCLDCLQIAVTGGIPCCRGSCRGIARAQRATGLLVVLVVAAACSGSHGNSAAPAGSTVPPTTRRVDDRDVRDVAVAVRPRRRKGRDRQRRDRHLDHDRLRRRRRLRGRAGSRQRDVRRACKPMIAWCNAQGGINGRKIVGNYYDAKVAAGHAGDHAGLQRQGVHARRPGLRPRLRAGAAAHRLQALDDARLRGRYRVRERFRHATADPEPRQPGERRPPRSRSRSCSPTRCRRPHSCTRSSRRRRRPATRKRSGYPKAGWKFLNCDQIYNVSGESDWKPIASNLKKCGLQAVVWVGSPDPNFEDLLNAVAARSASSPRRGSPTRTSTRPRSRKWNAQNGDAGNNVYVRMTGVPFELANQVPAVKEYISLVATSRTAPSASSASRPRRPSCCGPPA